jgi:hypothetical protein
VFEQGLRGTNMVQLKFEGPLRLRAMGSFTDMEMTLGLKIY